MTVATDPRVVAPGRDDVTSARRRRDLAASLAFVAAIAAIGAVAFVPGRAPALTAENRVPAPWPASMSTHFTAGFDRAFADRFGARDLLLRVHNRVLVRGFGVSPAKNVLIGRDGWLYFKGEEGTSLDMFYRGSLPLPDADIARISSELRRRAQFLAAHGIAYVVAIAPDKATVYPEHLPRWTKPIVARTPLDRLTDALRADGRVHYVDLREPLVKAKAHEQVYYATDSHWNVLGARVAYGGLMRAISDALAPSRVTAAPVVLPQYVPGHDVYHGDLARMTGDPGHFAEPDYAPLDKLLAAAKSRCAQRVDSGEEPNVERYACARSDLPASAIVYRDSMAIALVPMLSENFQRVTYITGHRLDPALVLRERPVVVVDEMVERAMLGPVATPMPDTGQ
jgi:alginate O-acetyltransferase complex protein AlgJ